MKSKTRIFRFLAIVVIAGAGVVAMKMFVFSSTEKNDPDVKDDEHREFVKNNYRIFSLALPDSVNFAGEKVPVEDIEVRERLDRELVINTYWHSQTLFFIKKANRWFPLMEKILKEEGVPDDFKFIAMIESGFDNVVSPAGAAGYWQFLKSSGAHFGLEVNSFVDERYNVEKATRAACKFLKESYARFNNWTLVAAAYNMGPGGVMERQKEQGVTSFYDLYLVEETRRYIFRILAAKEIYDHPLYYGFNLRKKDLYPPLKTKTIEVDTTITDLVKFSKSQKVNYKILKYLNPWLRDKSLPNKMRKKYQVLLPADDFDMKPDLK
ncbi:MAG TPA: lytic transglycosylase domain-containing protein [Flavobacteriales bacterium]|nr:lytic transglycosylase domain-containing protein [Flavobacteriales bacterium]